MTIRMPLLISISSLMLAFATAAHAQSGSSDPEFEGNAGAVILNGLSVIKRQDLYFGVIAPSLTLPSTVKVNRGRNNDSICDPELTCLRPGARARFTIIGEPNMFVTIDDPGEVTIFDDAGNQMQVTDFTGAGSSNNTDWRGWQKLRNGGFSRFNVGALLHVKPNQPPGEYTGTFTITVNYQ